MSCIKVRNISLFILISIIVVQGCAFNSDYRTRRKYHLIVLAPAHFHASLVQKVMYDEIDPVVQVFASPTDSSGVKSYLSLIGKYNRRANDPTHWRECVYIHPDYM